MFERILLYIAAALAIVAGAEYAQIQHLRAAARTAAMQLQESEARVTASRAESEELRRKTDNLTKSQHTVVQRVTRPDGTRTETVTTDSHSEDHSAATDSKESLTSAQESDIVNRKLETTLGGNAPANWSVSAWAEGQPEDRHYGASAGLRLGPTPLWLEGGYIQGQGYLLGLRLEF